MSNKNQQDDGYVSQNEESNDNDNIRTSVASFKDFLLKDELMRAIEECGFEKPSDVQNETLNYAVTGRDILCQAQAGTGKTAVFVLSILNSITKDDPTATCLVLAPVRELAVQIRDEFRRFAKYMAHVKIQSYFGGEPIEKSVQNLKQNQPQIIVGCPGRILQLVRDKHLVLKKIKYFVIDECDRMMEDQRTRNDLTDIFTETPKAKQTMMFSGTISDEVSKVCQKYLQNPITIIVKDQSQLVLNGLNQFRYDIEENKKINTLKNILKTSDYNQAIIFASNPERVTYLSKDLEKSDFYNLFTHARLQMSERQDVYRQFKEQQRRILVTNDLFGRGMDFSKVNMVINFDFPVTKEAYLHRVGRAGRQRTKGTAISFVTTSEDKKLVEQLEKDLNLKLKNYDEEVQN